MKHTSTLFMAVAAILMILSPGSSTAQVPANDECSGATVISSLPFTVSQNTRLATPNPSDPALACANGGGGKTVWFQYTADSTRYVTFSTSGSEPQDYDIAMGLYHGSCGSLILDSCNDDIIPGVVRQSEIRWLVQAGTTYTIQIAEWNGGGPSGGVPTGGDLFFRVCSDSCPQLPFPIVKGPKSGSVASGALANTGPEAAMVMGGEGGGAGQEVENEPDVPLLPTPPDVMKPKGPKGSNFKELKSIEATMTPPSKPVILKNFLGFTSGDFPPDPTMAVGPNHVVAIVNHAFRIWDKNGTLLKDIGSDSWFSNVVANYAGDPQILYDQFDHRWVMAGLEGSTPNKLVISVSDDDNPIGAWYNYALPEGLGDSTTGAFADYPQMGFDEQAVYITTREFGTGFFYSRVRIIPKTELYANTGGPVSWTDFWDFREPDHPSVRLDGIRPSVIFTPVGVHFLVNASPYVSGTFFTVWTIHDPIGTPSITGANIPVVAYNSAPNPGQPGGGNPFEGGGSAVRHKTVYRDSSLWVVHSVASGPGDAYSALHYVRLNPFTNTNLEDVAAGIDGYWHFYPALMVDAEKNFIVTFSRSGTTEYAGAYVAGHRNSDPPGISSSVALKLGLGHYDPVAPGQRNRWGDYMGVGLDPVDTTAIWVHT
ncbi:MAG: hypothetical protein HY277_00360 [Ignavibacteriales bacterium]|nr:hypothetical protein [Ignavibacteriales bacterium]